MMAFPVNWIKLSVKLRTEAGNFVDASECYVISINAPTDFTKNKQSSEIFERILKLKQRIFNHFKI